MTISGNFVPVTGQSLDAEMVNGPTCSSVGVIAQGYQTPPESAGDELPAGTVKAWTPAAEAVTGSTNPKAIATTERRGIAQLMVITPMRAL